MEQCLPGCSQYKWQQRQQSLPQEHSHWDWLHFGFPPGFLKYNGPIKKCAYSKREDAFSYRWVVTWFSLQVTVFFLSMSPLASLIPIISDVSDIFLSMSECLPACVCVYHMCACCRQGSGRQIPCNWVTDVCNLPRGCWESNLNRLSKVNTCSKLLSHLSRPDPNIFKNYQNESYQIKWFWHGNCFHFSQKKNIYLRC